MNIIIRDRAVGDTESISGQIVDLNEDVIDLTGLTVTFRMVDNDTGTVIVDDETATIQDATTGKVYYQPAAADVATAGMYACYFTVETTPPKRFPYEPCKYLIHITDEYGYYQ